jgi:hypothetical protein
VAEHLRAQGIGDTSLLKLKELEEENRAMEQRLGAARARLSELVGRLGFLEEQATTNTRSETPRT